ncbi:pro-pol polyprotein [Lasius niger]|uniref:Pro-pol polyprotein n=1 Tax=Lasius niger TaxID=67767 RepID=A0A0J7K430_LASNI|nr:pro-pol polyprotein [Lasius niger]
MSHVDCLSRNIMTVNTITLENELIYRQLTDPKLKELADMVELKGMPEQMINNIIRIHHDDSGHVGLDKTVYVAASKSEGEMELVERDQSPMQTLHVDHYGPLELTGDKYKFILVVLFLDLSGSSLPNPPAQLK